jgi:ABC-type multidrug transport system permease subunit
VFVDALVPVRPAAAAEVSEERPQVVVVAVGFHACSFPGRRACQVLAHAGLAHAGRTIADLLTQVIGVIVVMGVGLAIGWRIHAGPGDALAALGLALLLGYAFTWAGACLGMTLRSTEAAQQLGFILFLPLTFISNAFVPTQGMPGWLQVVADWNPLSALAAACRHLFGNPNPSAAVHAWPMQHPELTVVAWAAALIAVFAPLSVRLYRRKSL